MVKTQVSTASKGCACLVRVFVALAVGLSTFSATFSLAAPHSPEILFESRDLRIFRTLSRDGKAVLVLTNLDDEGNSLAGPTSPGAQPEPPPVCRGPAPDAREIPAGGDVTDLGRSPAVPDGRAAAGTVRVVVNRDGGPDSGDESNVEVTTDGSGGTTVVININPPAPPEKEAAAMPVAPVYPMLAIGGLAGAYRYPDHLPFLGYGLDTTSPSWFGGLGLNAGNGFGLSSGTPCTRGFGCMFGPRTHRP